MKTLLFTLLIVSGSFQLAHAQRYEHHHDYSEPMADKGSFEIGGNIGLNLASVTSPQTDNNYYNSPVTYGYKVGLNLSAFAEYYFSDKWSMKLKVIYDQKGWTDATVTDANGNVFPTTFRMNYITVPLLASVHFGRTRNWFVNFGPYVGFLLNASESTLGTDFTSAFNSTDAGLALGIGVKIPLTDKLKLLIEDDGQAGLANIINSNTGNGTAQNTRSAINVGIIYSVK